MSPAPPMVLASTRGEPGVLAHIGRTTLALLEVPEQIAPPHGGWLVVLEAAAGSAHASCDLLRLPAGATLDGTGIVRALLFASSEEDPSPVPRSWSEVPEPPFAPYEEREPRTLPVQIPGDGAPMTVEEVSTTLLAMDLGDVKAEVPRYWAARMLYRLALHGLRVGYAETYGGFFVDDRDEAVVRFGLRGAKGEAPAAVEVSRERALETIERLYRAVAPPGYRERLP